MSSAPGIPPTDPAVIADIAALKADASATRLDFVRIDKTLEKLNETMQALSKDLNELKISFESVKTRLNIAIGVAVFIAGLAIPALVKSFTAPAAPVVSAAEQQQLRLQEQMRDLQAQMQRLQERFSSSKPPI